MPGAGNPQSLNRYTYVYNNPLAYIDPSGHVAWVPLGAAVGALIGAGIGYGTQVAANLNRGMDFGQALTTDLDAAKIVRGAVTGAVIGTGIGAVASLVAAGAATASVATAGTAATTAVTAAVSDDGGAGEAQALATMAQRVTQVGAQSPQGQALVQNLAQAGTHGELTQNCAVSLGHYVSEPGALGYVDWAVQNKAVYLNLEQSAFATLDKAGQFWAVNRQFLDNAIRVGARFHLQYPQARTALSNFAREIDYLLKVGYQKVLIDGQWWLIPGAR